MNIAILSVLVIALVAIFLRLLRSPQKTASRGGSKAAYKRSELSPLSRAGSQYKSISIVCDSGACEASKASRGKRFLTSEAPLFPLPDCTSTACSCKYVHYVGRKGIIGWRVMRFEPGYVITLNQSTTQPLVATVEGVPKFLGFPGTTKGVQSFQIHQVLEISE